MKAFAKMAAPLLAEPRDEHEEGKAEDRGRADVDVDRRLELPDARHVRREPECGPAAVASTPETISAPHAAPTTSARAADPGGDGLAAHVPRIQRNEDAEREHDDREQEVRADEPWVQLVVDGDLPSGAWASVPANASPATQRTQRGTDGTRSEATNAARVDEDRERRDDPVRELDEASGSRSSANGSPAWHPGQCRQPSPEPVSLTVVPEATITISITALASASRR